MNVICRLAWLLLLTVFASLPPSAMAAKPSPATGKAYSLTLEAQPTYGGTPPTIQTPVPVQATLTNLAPPSTASSNVGSWELLITNPGVTFFEDDTHHPSGTSGTVAKTSDTRILITGMAPLKGDETYVLSFWVTSCGDAQYDATVHTGSSLNGDVFDRKNDKADLSNLQTLIKCADPGLACGEAATLIGDVASLTPELTVVRGGYNKDGGTCSTSTFYASNKLLTANGQVHFRWPVTGAASPEVFAYSVTSLNALPPKVGWLYSDGSGFATDAITNKTVAYIAAPQCLLASGQAFLPAPYGILSQNANGSTLQIKVNTSPQNSVQPVPSPFPAGGFDIIVGGERMHVGSISGSTWNVQRGQGGTANTIHSSGARVMSTPLPLIASADPATLPDGTNVTPIPAGRTTPYPYDLPPLGTGRQAQMCLVGSPVDNGDGTWSSTIIDIGDGWVRIGQ